MSGPAKATDAAPEASAPVSRVPSTNVLTIEYPGYITRSSDSLERALASLSPLTGPRTDSASSAYALAHLTTLLERGGRVIECRLPSWTGKHDEFDLYRHPLLGDVSPSDTLVVRVHKQVWKRVVQGTVERRKQYRVEVLGPSSTCIRFRRMADYAFRPEMPAHTSEHPTMKLHRALEEMDVAAMRAHRFPPESQEYHTTEGGQPRSNLAMIPPPFFNRQELPFYYGYRQNPTSSLQTVSFASTSKRSRRTARKGDSDLLHAGHEHAEVTRYLNRARWRNMAPIAVKFAEAGPVPTEPDAMLAQMSLTERQATQLEQLKKYLSERPVWSRLSLLNQFSVADARALVQTKELFALVAYTFADGPWRDALVRFGYDPREDPASRLYAPPTHSSFQRIHLRGKAPRFPTTRGAFKAEYGKASVGTKAEPASALGDAQARPPTHLFDGQHVTFSTSTFQLCDITAPTLVPLVQTEGPGHLLSTPDITTGWYAASAWEAIRSSVSKSFHALLSEAEPQPAKPGVEAMDSSDGSGGAESSDEEDE
ncbi:tau 95 subunit of transcription factor TFIIIC [Malassezia caprae]|uniref:Tau 95 subunit of transcription factor TFIIIC n=1 Tax=Malassezia caprae TaxID=1381934 RepID=A0AAF0E5Q5_9BASI|nr:tau 95 subunit of transcription factor TFIIIC [Malassezia caprae]